MADGPRFPGLEASDHRYPLPFSEAFHAGLAAWQRTRRTSLVPTPGFQTLTLVVIERECEDRDTPEVAALNDLALAAAVKRLGATLLEDEPALGGLEVKTTGAVSIDAFPGPGAGVAFAGAPVNFASKLAQDVADFGSILLTASCAREAGIGSARTFQVRVSGVSIEAVAI